MPRAWAGVDSKSVRRWLVDFLQHPTPNLPPDPGAGERRVSLSLPKRQVKVVSGLLDEIESAALRRIIAARIGALPLARSFSLPAPRVAESLRSSVPVSRPVPIWRRVPDFGGWIPLRSLEVSPALPQWVAIPDSDAPSESHGLLELAAWIAVAALVLWLVVQLFHANHVLV
jgi:hypothetical protein